MIVKSPAKLNLNLKVLGKRADGYHELLSLFQTIDLYDEINIELHHQDEFSSSDINLPMDERNLVVKALNLFRKTTQIPFFVKIHLTKNIPQEAGLGGGSSNAAHTLIALNKLLNFPIKDLHPLAAKLGSDVNFFLVGGRAICSGRGEIVSPVPSEKPESYWLVKPPFGCSTPLIFKNLPDERSGFMNELEPAAYIVEPRLKELKNSLVDQGMQKVQMTGSGSTFFCQGDKKPSFPPDYFIKQVTSV